MESQKLILIRDARVVATGSGGGHRYLVGRCDWNGEDVQVTVLVADPKDESRLTEGDILVAADTFDFTRGAGLLINDGRLPETT